MRTPNKLKIAEMKKEVLNLKPNFTVADLTNF